MIVTLNPLLQSLSGRLGNLVYYRSGQVQYARRYVVPRNPDTDSQRVVRRSFASAVSQWQELPLYKKTQWNRKALPLKISGYNHFISRFLRAGHASAGAASLCIEPAPFILSAGLSVSPLDLLYCGCELPNIVMNESNDRSHAGARSSH